MIMPKKKPSQKPTDATSLLFRTSTLVADLKQLVGSVEGVVREVNNANEHGLVGHKRSEEVKCAYTVIEKKKSQAFFRILNRWLAEHVLKFKHEARTASFCPTHLRDDSNLLLEHFTRDADVLIRTVARPGSSNHLARLYIVSVNGVWLVKSCSLPLAIAFAANRHYINK